MNESVVKGLLNGAPQSSKGGAPTVISLPMPDGSYQRFTVVDDPIMEAPLAAKFSEIKTYSGRGVDDPAATIALDFTPHGFHAQILKPSGAVYIDPYWENDSSAYISYFKSDYVRDPKLGSFHCEEPLVALANSNAPAPAAGSKLQADPNALPPASGGYLRTYRLACAADGEYTTYQSNAQGHTPNVADGLAAVVTAINRVRGVYRTEIDVSLILVGKNDQIIFTDPATDPYSDQTNVNTLITDNQNVCDSVIGDANYDVGHVFTTGGGGAAILQSTCVSGKKAGGSTGLPQPIGDAFYIDFVAHEMGHSFGGEHTFNSNNPNNCGPNRNANSAYEPGSGTSLQSYAGVCPGDDIQPHSDPYFNASSYQEIVAYTTTGAGNCPVPTNTGNNPPTVSAGGSGNYSIPIRTPFALTAAGSDPDGDPVTYSWEERDLGPGQTLSDPDNGQSPIFRVFSPSASPTRTFPQLSDILGNKTTAGEKLPSVARVMHFRVTARDGRGGVSADDTAVYIADTAGPFRVTSPNTAVAWVTGSSQTVTWDVANTTASPVFAAQVNILLSLDGGNTFPQVLASHVPNNGSATITAPTLSTGSSQARIKVEAVGNIFFDISHVNFTVGSPPTVTVTSPANQSTISAFTSIAGTAVDHSGTGIAGNSINFTLFHVSSGQYWSGTNWSNTQVQISTAVDPNTNVWTFNGTLPNSSDGTLRGGQYALSASTHDNNGDNSVPQSGVNNITFTIDNSPPTVTISSPTQGSTLNNASFSFSGTANDDNTISRVVLFIRRNSDNTWWNGSTWVADSLQANLSSTYTSSDHSWVSNATLPAPGSTMANGSYNFQAKAFDNAGNFTFATADVTVDYHPQWTWTHGSLNDPNPANRNNRWDDPANWSPNGVPPGPAFVNISNDSVDASSIAHLTVYGLSLTNGAALTAPEVNLAAGGAMTWSDGYLTGTLNIPAGATAALSGTGLKWLGNNSVINNYGTIVWSGPGNLQGFQNATFNNFASGVLQVTGDGSVFQNYYGGNTFNNLGRIEKLTATGTTLFTDWTYISSGTIKATTGTIEFPAGATLTNDSIIGGGGRVRFSGGVLAINGNMHIDAGTFEITGTVSTSGTATLISTNGASVEWSGGTINGTVNIDPSMVLLVDGAGTKLVGNGATINNSGEMVWTGVGGIQGFQASTINNLSGSLFFVSNDSGLTNYYGGNVLNIAPGATFFKNASAAGTTQIDWSLNNNGLVRIAQGALALTNAGSSAGTFQMFSGALLRVLGGTQTMATGAKFIGAGKTQLVGGAIVAAGNASSGTASSASILEISGGTLTTSGTGTFTPYGTVNWTGGTIGGQFRIPAGSALNLSGASTKLLDNGGDIENAGTINFTGPGFLQGFQNGTINNLANAVFSVAGDGQVFANYYGGNVFNNAGTFTKASGSGTTVLTDWTFNNSGAINVASGSVEYDSTLNLNAGSTFVGAGLIRLAGAINVAASVSLTDQFVLAGGTFNSGDANNPPKLASGNLTWSSGTINGTWNIAAGATLTISGPDLKPLGNGAVLNNAGTILWSGAAIQGFQSVAINNQSGGNFNVNTDGGLVNVYGGNAFNNAVGATFTKTGTNGTCPIQWDVNNSGTWHVATGNLELYGGGLSSGNFTTDSGAIMRIAGGNQSLGNNAFLQGGGKYQITGGALTVAGTNVKAGAPANLATVELMTGGTLGSSANALTAIGTLNWTGGSLTSLLLPAGSTMNVSGPDTKVLSNGGIIENNGTIKWSGGGPIQAFQSGTILNASGAIFDAQADGRPIDQTYGGSNFLNQGAFIKSGGTGATTLDVWTFYSGSGGSIEAHAGSIVFANELHLNGGGTLLGYQAATNFITSNGTTYVAGTTLLNGATFILSNHALIGGATAQLDAVNGALFEWTGGTLNGTLSLSNRTPSFVLGPNAKSFGNGAVLNNSGFLTLISGSSVQGFQSTALNNLAGATLTIESGATLTSTYGGNVLSNAGTLNFAHSTTTLALAGWGFTQTSSGVLNLRVAGASAFDALSLGNNASLDGTLNVSLINNYLPNVGDTFPLLTYSSATGSFSTVHSPGFDFNTVYNAGNFSLVAASQPTLAEWKQGYFTDPNSAQASDTASPAGDGMANLLKYALGLNPTLPFTSSIPLIGFSSAAAASGPAFTTDAALSASSSKHPTFSFRRIDPVNVTYLVQASDNMADPNSWTEVARLNTGTTAWFGLDSVTETGSGSTRQVTVTDTFTFQQKSKRFFRLLVSH